ncbi:MULTISPECIES: hypothetical protein [unclassified Thalassospira]|uniref:hypothetical protein n=1 Tax=unclassified Thalassospira TaxID=2648997 RepID=UPI0007A5DC03|nr:MULTISPECIES: hypothetical protein [unclassified Thalassospira]KZC99633.1 hypothetical protein AUQ41_08060 [Thalassospira sp. MCCC 1A02898]ONH85280.1 hypothetical protein TH47_11745 [Thalassospira sp. MCCC 1A02803]
MLDASYLRDMLSFVEEGSYTGVTNEALVRCFAPDIFDKAVQQSEDFAKFKYHMDEAWGAGLIRRRDSRGGDDWGVRFGSSGSVALTRVDLVLTPIGGEALAEMRKSKGAERLVDALKSAGGVAGREALSQGIAALLRASI